VVVTVLCPMYHSTGDNIRVSLPQKVVSLKKSIKMISGVQSFVTRSKLCTPVHSVQFVQIMSSCLSVSL
jgi:hypothetical protein